MQQKKSWRSLCLNNPRGKVVFLSRNSLFKKQSPTQGKDKDNLNGYSLHPDERKKKENQPNKKYTKPPKHLLNAYELK